MKLVIILAFAILAVGAQQKKTTERPPEDGPGTGRTFSLVSLPSLLPSLLSGPEFNLFNINKPPIVFGSEQSSGASPGGGFFGLPSVWVVNTASTQTASSGS